MNFKIISASVFRNPVYMEMYSRTARFDTFITARAFTHKPTCSYADAGFFSKGPKDTLTCFDCGGEISNWQNQDPWLEHAKWFGFCPFLIKAKGQHFIGSAVNLRKGLVHNAETGQLVATPKLEMIFPKRVLLARQTC